MLSGGGAKGAFEAGAIAALWKQGYRPDIVCGVSVGAVNAIKLAEKQPDLARLAEDVDVRYVLFDEALSAWGGGGDGPSDLGAAPPTGEDQGAHRNALLMGTSLVLEVAGIASDARDGVARAADAVDSGRASDFLTRLKAHFAD